MYLNLCRIDGHTHSETFLRVDHPESPHGFLSVMSPGISHFNEWISERGLVRTPIVAQEQRRLEEARLIDHRRFCSG